MNGQKCPFIISGAPGETRTPDHLVRSQVLYPTELRAHKGRIIDCNKGPSMNLYCMLTKHLSFTHRNRLGKCFKRGASLDRLIA